MEASKLDHQATCGRPETQRQFAELLVDGGFLSRREAESALRESRRREERLADLLVRKGQFKGRQIIAIRRLHTLLNSTTSSAVRLGELLLECGEITPRQLRAVLDSRKNSKQGLGRELVQNGYLGVMPRAPDRSHHERWAAATLGITVVLGYLGLLLSVAGNASLTSPITESAYHALADVGLDLRFVSLGDIAARLRSINPIFRNARSLPTKYRLRARKYSPMVQNAATQYRLPPEMLYAMIETESGFNPLAHSGSNAVGLMQLTPHGGAQVAAKLADEFQTAPTIEQLKDPRTNIQLGAAYMRMLLDKYFDDVPDEDVRMAVALAAYNWGPTKVRAVLHTEGMPDSVEELQKFLRKHAAPVETRDYVRIITERMDSYS